MTPDAGSSRSGPAWRSEPFRILFPLGMVLGWAGISHWIFYAAGWLSAYSCELHAAIQMQAFAMAFALGFLFTAIPRRTQSAPAATWEIASAVALLAGTTVGGLAERWWVVELCYIAMFVLLARFALSRFVGRAAKRRPPAAFVLVPIAILQGIVGAVLMLVSVEGGGGVWARPLARLLVEQGVFLGLVAGVGGLVVPLVGGWSPPADLGSSPRETWRAIAFAAAGVALVATEVVESLGSNRVAPIARGVVVAGALALGGDAWRWPKKPGFHRRLVWVSIWLTPLGVVLSGVFPDHRVAALHVLFVGGFSLMVISVATHVSFAHVASLEPLMTRRHPAVIVVGAMLLFALATRVTADLFGETYFEHLAAAAGLWIAGSAVWLAFLGSKLLRA